MTSNDLEVGVVGVGTMGGAMARHLLDSGVSVVAYDADEAARHTVSEVGAGTVDSPAAVATEVEVLLTSLPNSTAVEDVYLGADGVVEGPRPDALTLETSTIDPATTDQRVEHPPTSETITPVARVRRATDGRDGRRRVPGEGRPRAGPCPDGHQSPRYRST